MITPTVLEAGGPNPTKKGISTTVSGYVYLTLANMQFFSQAGTIFWFLLVLGFTCCDIIFVNQARFNQWIAMTNMDMRTTIDIIELISFETPIVACPIMIYSLGNYLRKHQPNLKHLKAPQNWWLIFLLAMFLLTDMVLRVITSSLGTTWRILLLYASSVLIPMCVLTPILLFSVCVSNFRKVRMDQSWHQYLYITLSKSCYCIFTPRGAKKLFYKALTGKMMQTFILSNAGKSWGHIRPYRKPVGLVYSQGANNFFEKRF